MGKRNGSPLRVTMTNGVYRSHVSLRPFRTDSKPAFYLSIRFSHIRKWTGEMVGDENEKERGRRKDPR